MPSVIIILLAIAALGLVGSLALIIVNLALGFKRPAPVEEYDEFEDEHDEEPALNEDSRKVVFTPLEEPNEIVIDEPERVMEQVEAEPIAQEEVEEPETAAPVLHLVTPVAEPQKNATEVGDICLSIGNAQDVGARPQQQDAFAITPLEERDVVESHGVMAVVCDGMGGMENGAEAANLGAVQFMRAYLENNGNVNNMLVDAVYAANREVYAAFAGKDGTVAGTTLVAASILPDGLRFVSVGDSHIYLYRSGKLYQLNRDHNYFMELMEQVKEGTLTLEEAQQHPERAHLTSFVGIETLEKVDYNIEPVDLRKGDRVLLCSDGLFKTLSIKEIASAIENADEGEAQDALLSSVLAKGKRKQDNVTIVMLYCD